MSIRSALARVIVRHGANPKQVFVPPLVYDQLLAEIVEMRKDRPPLYSPSGGLLLLGVPVFADHELESYRIEP